eukprot:4045084-Prymnesium_polylepis.1
MKRPAGHPALRPIGALAWAAGPAARSLSTGISLRHGNVGNIVLPDGRHSVVQCQGLFSLGLFGGEAEY